jgi:hypothetical protein
LRLSYASKASPRRESSSNANAPSIVASTSNSSPTFFADQLASASRQLLASRFRRLPEVDSSPALGRLLRDPGLEAQAGNLLELVDRLVPDVTPQLLDRRLGVSEVPEDEAEKHARYSKNCS